MTGVSHPDFPSSTSLARSSVVIALVFDAIMKSVSASIFSGFAEVADAEASREDDLAVLDQSDGNAGYAQLVPRPLDERRAPRCALRRADGPACRQRSRDDSPSEGGG